ncbi:mediator of RNA polymerase II transcription subunit 19 [Harpegnathos saltator]|uniref:Mediator of RNA polymerase II transcription subunit 19 n=1 Tax=Harpegnathos saltator TaxID=610380 RepID=E2B310_HARSA|nr:mediator of RNA polymerase II transcription subunit 19 [Harpegnathos saltator]XP_011154815.1 mediator of RNA polymerase II transcription subunit 19 [Harpegnathos saltator]EFN89979.1 Mediator of RNA polymerase II transcription subunit 19 [Harpegnathos saltator]
MMMGEQFRSKVEQYSPKSSPRGARSPVVSRQDSTGTLKTTISLGKNPSIVHSGPFYLMKEPPGESELTGATNLMAYYGLEHSYSKFSGKKLKEQLSSFLPNLPGIIDRPGHQDNSSLRSVIEKPPIGGKELLPLTSVQLAGFRLHPGPLPEQYRYVNQAPQRKHKNKHKKHKHKPGEVLGGQEATTTDVGGSDTHEKKHKKQKRHDEEKEARKKRKKEKKRKKQKHSPEHTGSLTPSQHSNS